MTPLLRGALLAALMCFGACFDDRVAGGTDEVENPAFTAILKDGKGEAISGTVRLYARFQNPSKDSMPVLTAPAQGAVGFEVRAKALVQAMEASAARGIPWKHKDSIAFNLVGSTAAEEAFAGDYLLRKDSEGHWHFRRLSPPEGGGPYPVPSLSTRLTLAAAVLAYKGSVGAKGVELGLKTLFVPGSPYHAVIGADGSFTVPRLAAGRYDVKALDGDGKVYGAVDSLDTAVPFAPTDWSEADIIWVGE